MDRTEPPTRLRADVVTARSRMRTKYGARREIGLVGELLEIGEVLLQLAVTAGPARADRRQHGLLALTDNRLLYVPKASSQGEFHETQLGLVHAMTWSTDADGGTLGVIGVDVTRSYGGLSRPDGRDLIVNARTVRPVIRYLGAPG